MSLIPILQNPFTTPVSLRAGLAVRFSRQASEYFRRLILHPENVAEVQIDQVALSRAQQLSKDHANADTIGEAEISFILHDGRRHSEPCTIEVKGLHDLVLTTDAEAAWNLS
jgi:hypothetical protein